MLLVAKTIQSEIPDIQPLLNVFQRAGLLLFLEQYPFEQIKFVKELTFDNVLVNGTYSYRTNQAEICVTRDANEYNQVYQHQRFWSISSLAKTELEAVQRTMIHETGHHLHNILRFAMSDLFVHTIRHIRSSALSQYALRNEREYFAECFAARIFQPTELFIHDNLGYAMIDRVLTVFSIKIQELS